MFRPLLQRLLERVTALDREYGGGGPERCGQFGALLAQAEAIQVVEDQTRWVDVSSYSLRQERRTPIGGLLGQVRFAGDFRPFLPGLAWGELVHVGKDVVKGNGWYRMH